MGEGVGGLDEVTGKAQIKAASETVKCGTLYTVHTVYSIFWLFPPLFGITTQF